MIEDYFEAVAVGFCMAMPVGPIGMLCIRQTLARGRLGGFVCGMGAAAADAVYGAVAAFGLSFASGLIDGEKFWIEFLGGLCMMALGAFMYRSPAETREGPVDTGGLIHSFVGTFFLTLTNPMTIMAFAAVFAALGLGRAGRDHALASMLVAGVFTGASLWWLFLTRLVSRFRGRFVARMSTVNRIAGIAIAAFGVAGVITALS